LILDTFDVLHDLADDALSDAIRRQRATLLEYVRRRTA
jgi:hypothetical protein